MQVPTTFSLKNFKSESVDELVVKPQNINKKPSIVDWRNSYENYLKNKENKKIEDLEIYDLYGYVVHQGTTSRQGHYFSVVKSLSSEWVRCNDSKLTHLKNGIEDQNLDSSYLLFYQKRISSDHSKLQETPAPKKQA